MDGRDTASPAATSLLQSTYADYPVTPCPARLSRDERANSNASEGRSRAWFTGKSWTIMQRVCDRRHGFGISMPASRAGRQNAEGNPMRSIPVGVKGSFNLVVTPDHLANRFKDATLPPVLA